MLIWKNSCMTEMYKAESKSLGLTGLQGWSLLTGGVDSSVHNLRGFKNDFQCICEHGKITDLVGSRHFGVGQLFLHSGIC